MKVMKLIQMEGIIAGGQNRTCLISGGIATVCFISGFFLPAGFFAGAAITEAANIYGCFN